jgi:hypothetical protein
MFFFRFKGYHNICQSSPFSNKKHRLQAEDIS